VVVASARNAAGEANTVVVSGLSPEGPGAYGVAYRRAPTAKSHVEAKVRSARHPDFTRTYRVDQAADVVRSAATLDRVEALTFRASGAALAPLFDGQETLLSVTSFPWYVREISVP
jgi:hypothetical protein